VASIESTLDRPHAADYGAATRARNHAGNQGGASRLPGGEPPPKHAVSLAGRLADGAALASSSAFSFAPLFPAAEQASCKSSNLRSRSVIGRRDRSYGSTRGARARGRRRAWSVRRTTARARSSAGSRLTARRRPRHYLKFRGLVREAPASGTLLSLETGLSAYAFVLDLRRALSRRRAEAWASGAAARGGERAACAAGGASRCEIADPVAAACPPPRPRRHTCATPVAVMLSREVLRRRGLRRLVAKFLAHRGLA